MINQRITKLRQLMKERGIDLYIIPTSDFHQSEYVGSYFEARHYMSGFSGSAGTLIVREDEAYLSMAKDIVKTILDKQTTEVDTISGATYSSTGIKNAVGQALEGAAK